MSYQLMLDRGSHGDIGDPMLWDVPWDEHQWSHCRAIQTTACHCTPAEREKSRSIMISHEPQRPKTPNGASKSRLAARQVLRRALSLSQPKRKPSQASGFSSRDMFHQSQSQSHKPRPATLTNLPPEILHPILEIVYEEEERSRDLCHCSRPRTLYRTVKEIALEHRAVNTLTLRSVCRAFHLWAHYKILRSNAEVTLEVDFSDFQRLQTKFGTDGPGVARRLAEDFPGVVTTGIVIYIGSPGQVSNIISVVQMLETVKNNFFSGVSLWDLDYYFRDELPELVDKAAYIAATGISNDFEMNDVAQVMPPVMQLYERIYDKDALLFLNLIKRLGHRPLAKLHLPLSSLLSLSPDDEEKCTLFCRNIIFREFFDYLDISEAKTLQHLKSKYSHLCDQSLLAYAGRGEPPYGTRIRQVFFRPNARQLSILRRENLATSIGLLGLSDATYVEFRRLGIRIQNGRQASWPGITDQDIQKLCGSFNRLKSVNIIGGKLGRLLDESGVRTGAVLKGLLPSTPTLTSLIYRPSNPDLYPENRNHYVEEMDPNHPCTFIPQFSRLETLDIQTRLCLELFRHSKWMEKNEIPLNRDWDLRINKCTGHCHSKKNSNESWGLFAAEEAHQWTSSLIQTLLQDCRDWRNRHEEIAGKRLAWDVKIHMIKFKDIPGPLDFEVHRYDIVFMPLARPPAVLLKVLKRPYRRIFLETLEEENEAWFKNWYEGEDIASVEDDEDSLDLMGWGGPGWGAD